MTTAIQKAEGANLKVMLDRAKETVASVIPKGFDPDKIVRVAYLACYKDENLRRADPVSLVTAVVQAARLGLEIGGALQHAYLVAYGNQVQMLTGYRGLIELALRGGKVLDIFARVVYQGDEFELIEGTEPRIMHKPALEVEREDKGIIGAYAVAVLPGGIRKHEWVSRIEIEKVRRVSRAKDSGPWKSWYPEMCAKTAIRRLSKVLPLSPDFAAALELDNRAETGEITAALDGFDTPESIVESVQKKTIAKGDEIKERLAQRRVGANTPAAEKGEEPAKSSTSDQNSGAGNAEPGEPASGGAFDKRVRQSILDSLAGMKQAELHKAVKEGCRAAEFEDLADINSLVHRVTGLDTYQEIDTPEQAADVLYAARVTAAEMSQDVS